MTDVGQRSEELAVLFADVVGSTKLYELLGDERARQTVSRCIDVMTRATEHHHGMVIKTMGDEILATFTAAGDAVEAACTMQKMIKENMGDVAVSVAIRVGLHFGKVMLEDGDVFGGTVHTANRMTSQAKASQIITTRGTVDCLSGQLQSITRQIDLATVKGRSDEIALYEVMWQREESTTMLPTLDIGAVNQTGHKIMRLKYRNKEIRVGEGHQSNINIGRAEDSDLIVKGTLISRLHARIEYARGKFTLYDQSTNGTCVISHEGEELYVRRDSVQIKGDGMIGLGRIAQADTAHTIAYFCEE